MAERNAGRATSLRAGNDNGDETFDAVSAAVMLAAGAPATLTLTLDADRHLRLRIACALRRCSAQAVLRDALDAHLQTLADVERHAVEAGNSGVAASQWGLDG